MNEWQPVKRGEQEHPEVDERLTAYYGPALREQPLPFSAWQKLHSRLKSQNSPRFRLRLHIRRRHFRQQKVVSHSIENAFTRIAFEARFPCTSSILAYAYKARLLQPQVRVMPLAKRKIRLKLPMHPAALDPAALDVLLATGLARYLHMRRPAYAIKRFLGYGLLVLGWVVPGWWFWHPLMPRLDFPIAIMLCIALYAVVLWLLHRQACRMALQADTLMILWLGRGHVCQGLHALEERSRISSRRRWGELSLAERIAHVCGTEVPMQHERLTLVR